MNKEGDFTGLSGNVQRIGLLAHELRLQEPRPARLRRVGREGEGRRCLLEPADLPRPREAERGRAGPVFRLGRERGSSTPPSACASRRGRCACTRCIISTGWAAAPKAARRTGSGSTTTAAGWRAATSRRGATFPASGRTPRSQEEPQGVMPRDQPGDRARTSHRAGGTGVPPGPGSGPAPAQLSNPPSQPHQH